MELLWLLPIGFLSGIAGAVVSAFSLVSFPALLLLGYSPLTANVTNSVGGVLPGAIGQLFGYRRLLKTEPAHSFWLGLPAAIGGLLGAIALLVLGEKVFKVLVPFLVCMSAVLILFQPQLQRRLALVHESRDHMLPAMVGTFLLALYAGYFGAGAGIIAVAVYAICFAGGLLRANVLKSYVSLCMNGVAGLFFMFSGHVAWDAAAVLAMSSIVGGFAGAHLVQRLPENVLRAVLVVASVTITLVVVLR